MSLRPRMASPALPASEKIIALGRRASLTINADLPTASSHRPADQPAIVRPPQHPSAARRPDAPVSRDPRVLRPLVGHAFSGVPSRDCRSLRAPAFLFPRARLQLPSPAVRARVSAYPRKPLLHLRLIRPWSQVTTGGFAHVQKVSAEISNVER
jgi:hypothetical protein